MVQAGLKSVGQVWVEGALCGLSALYHTLPSALCGTLPQTALCGAVWHTAATHATASVDPWSVADTV